MHAFRSFLPLALLCGFCVTFCSLPVLAQAPDEEEEIGKFFDRVLLPPGLSKEEIQQTIAMVLPGRGWTVKKKTDRRVVGYINHGGAEATVTMLFNGEAVEIYAFGWDLNRAGKRVKDFYPTRWLRYLRKDLQTRLQP